MLAARAHGRAVAQREDAWVLVVGLESLLLENVASDGESTLGSERP